MGGKRLRRFFVIAMAGLVVASIAPAALGGPPEPTFEFIPVDVTLRDGSGDVLQSDAPTSSSSTYADNDSASFIINGLEDSDPATETPFDRFSFFPWRQREFRLQHDSIESGAPVSCGNFSRVAFRSRTTPQWFDAIHEGGSAVGDASIVCILDQQFNNVIRVDYPGNEDNEGEGECVEVSLVATDPLTVRFEAEPFVEGDPGDPGIPPIVPPTEPTPDSGCPATITKLTREHPNNEFTETELASKTSAPFEITAVQKPEKGNPDKP